ncbi:hypothetical protein [Micromonospora sediminicola]|uniref:hypothetical protein n=1 Tax=Micromonospora sediminicola TaxID=946078 RepID=UPI003796CD88
MTAASWVQVGAAVTEHTYSASGGTFTPATISRLTATLIVLDNGNRYRRDTLRPPGDSSYNRRLIQREEP